VLTRTFFNGHMVPIEHLNTVLSYIITGKLLNGIDNATLHLGVIEKIRIISALLLFRVISTLILNLTEPKMHSTVPILNFILHLQLRLI